MACRDPSVRSQRSNVLSQVPDKIIGERATPFVQDWVLTVPMGIPTESHHGNFPEERVMDRQKGPSLFERS